MKRSIVFFLAAVVASVFVAGAAWAVSTGNYSPDQMDCTPSASANHTPDGVVQPGCHNFALNVTDGNGKRYAEFGLDQLPQGFSGTPGLLSLGLPGQPNSVHSGCLGANTNGTDGGVGRGCGTGTGAGFLLNFDAQHPGGNHLSITTGTPDVAGLLASLMTGFTVSLGADDNLDAGEHDGVSGNDGTIGSINGPSDGGGTSVGVSPGQLGTTPTLSDPVPWLLAQLGACADGFCFEASTQRQTAYKGCDANPSVPCGGAPNSRDAANYGTKKWDPSKCSSGGSTSEAPGPSGCGNQTMDQWRSDEAKSVYTEPGFQLYEDPDPQGSPAGPIYPIPALYVGTCGVIAGGGPVTAPASPVTNSAGQVVVATGC